MTIEEAIRRLKEVGFVREPIPLEGIEPMRFVCTCSDVGASPEEIGDLPGKCPADLYKFWNSVRSAKLFEDKTYGQWGLQILDPQEAVETTRSQKSRRPKDFIEGDLVIGRFLGDSDLLLIRCDESAPDFDKVIVAIPLDPREDWYVVASSFEEFLRKYLDACGEKYWEQRG